MQGQPMKKDDEKEKPPKNSTKGRFPINLQELNSHDRDPRRLSKKLTQQTPNSTIKQKRMMYATVQEKTTYIRSL
jgi:hypothetical protein